ncbi:hypothetical protein HRbin06_00607 [archaeon HR06]|nr:hypothetical protein HRbin06_00607 [archaeon HR06]
MRFYLLKSLLGEVTLLLSFYIIFLTFFYPYTTISKLVLCGLTKEILIPASNYLKGSSLFFYMMGEPLLIMAGGYMLLFGLEKFFEKSFIKKFNPLISLTTIAFILTYWHIPKIFDLSHTNPDIYRIMHITFFLAGLLAYLTYKSLPNFYNFLLLSALHKAMMITSFLILASKVPIFQSFTLEENHLAGFYMAIMGGIFEVIDITLIARYLYLWFRGERIIRAKI